MRGTLHLVAASDYGAFVGAWHRQSRATMRSRTSAITSQETSILAALAAFTAEARSTDQLQATVRGTGERTGRIIP